MYMQKGKDEVGQHHGDKGGVSASVASVIQLLHKLEISYLLIVTFKVAIWKKQAAYVS